MSRSPKRPETTLSVLGCLALTLLGGCATANARDDSDSGDLFTALGMRPLEGKALASVEAEATRHPLGSEENPVRAAGPPGQRADLTRLRCPDGKAPVFERGGSLGPGIYRTIVDIYQIECEDGTKANVVIDMYHDHVELRPVPGFTIVAP